MQRSTQRPSRPELEDGRDLEETLERNESRQSVAIDPDFTESKVDAALPPSGGFGTTPNESNIFLGILPRGLLVLAQGDLHMSALSYYRYIWRKQHGECGECNQINSDTE